MKTEDRCSEDKRAKSSKKARPEPNIVDQPAILVNKDVRIFMHKYAGVT